MMTIRSYLKDGAVFYPHPNPSPCLPRPPSIRLPQDFLFHHVEFVKRQSTPRIWRDRQSDNIIPLRMIKSGESLAPKG